MHLVKQAATLQELSAGRFVLGVGIGWHRDEFEFMGIEFADRGARADEAVQVMRAMAPMPTTCGGSRSSTQGCG